MRGSCQWRNTVTTPAAIVASEMPPRTQGIPAAPSAAKECRLRRPMAICPPQMSRPMTPRIITSHLPQPMIVLTGPARPGTGTGLGSGTPARGHVPGGQVEHIDHHGRPRLGGLGGSQHEQAGDRIAQAAADPDGPGEGAGPQLRHERDADHRAGPVPDQVQVLHRLPGLRASAVGDQGDRRRPGAALLEHADGDDRAPGTLSVTVGRDDHRYCRRRDAQPGRGRDLRRVRIGKGRRDAHPPFLAGWHAAELAAQPLG